MGLFSIGLPGRSGALERRIGNSDMRIADRQWMRVDVDQSGLPSLHIRFVSFYYPVRFDAREDRDELRVLGAESFDELPSAMGVSQNPGGALRQTGCGSPRLGLARTGLCEAVSVDTFPGRLSLRPALVRGALKAGFSGPTSVSPG
jgi:hypothetical protein